jgi:hypothetical protein
MTRAKVHLRELGWRVHDVSLTHPYDFDCSRGEERLIVEVKGTTSAGSQIVITRNEVGAQRAHHPNNALIVVHSINLIRAPNLPTAEGGELVMITPWYIEDRQLEPIAFQYTTSG